MFPLRDDIPSQRFPVVTTAIIALNVAAFFFELALGPRLQEFLRYWAVVPVRYSEPDVAGLCSIIKVKHFYRRHHEEEFKR